MSDTKLVFKFKKDGKVFVALEVANDINGNVLKLSGQNQKMFMRIEIALRTSRHTESPHACCIIIDTGPRTPTGFSSHANQSQKGNRVIAGKKNKLFSLIEIAPMKG